jgi:hypothetical protein
MHRSKGFHPHLHQGCYGFDIQASPDSDVQGESAHVLQRRMLLSAHRMSHAGVMVRPHFGCDRKLLQTRNNWS